MIFQLLLRLDCPKMGWILWNGGTSYGAQIARQLVDRFDDFSAFYLVVMLGSVLELCQCTE